MLSAQGPRHTVTITEKSSGAAKLASIDSLHTETGWGHWDKEGKPIS